MYGGALAQITKRAKASKDAKDAKDRPRSPRSPANARKPIRAASMWQSRASVNKTSKADVGMSGKVGALSRKNKSNFGITMGDIVDDDSSSGSEGATSAVAQVADRAAKDRRRRRHDSGEAAPHLKKTPSGHGAAGVLALGLALRTDTDGSDKEKKARVPRPIGQYRSRSVLDQLDSPPSGATSSVDAAANSNLFSRSSLRASKKIGQSRRSSDLGLRSGSSRLLDSPSESAHWGSSNRLKRKTSRISVHTGGRESNEVSSKPGEEVGGGVELDGLSQLGGGGGGHSRSRSSSGGSSASSAGRSSSRSGDSRPPHHVAGDNSSLDSYRPDDRLAQVYQEMPDSASQWGGGGGGRKRVTRALLSEEDIAKRRRRSTSSIKTYFPVGDTIVREYGAVWSRYHKFVVRNRHKYEDGFAPYDTARLEPESSGCSHWWYYTAPWARDIRSRIYLTLSEPSTGRAAQWFSIFVMLVIILSSVTFVIESYPQYRIEAEVNGNANETFVIIELVAVIIFTIEYLARLLTVSGYPTVAELTDMNTFMVHMEYAISAAVAEQAEERQAQARDAWMAELQQNEMRRSEEDFKAGEESPGRSAVASPGVATPNVAAPGGKRAALDNKPRPSLNAWGETTAASVGADSVEEEVIEHVDSKAMDPVQRVLHGIQEHTPAQDAEGQHKAPRKGGLKGGASGTGGGEMARLMKSPTGLTTAATNKEALGTVQNPHALHGDNKPSQSASNMPWWKKQAPPPPPVYDRTCCGMCRSDTPSKVYAFLRSPINMIDLLAILPFYIELAVGGAAGNVGLTVFRILRLGRIFRIFKLSKYSTGMQLMGRVIVASADAMGLLLFFIAIGVIVFGSIMFFAEAGEFDPATGVYMRRAFTGDEMEPTPFTSIPMAFWYVVVTATTVGYGEMVPTSVIGQMVGVLVMLAGILVLALPITVFGAQFAVEYATATEEENEDEAEEGEHYAYDEYGNPYYIGPGADDGDGPALPDDVSVVLTPEALKAAHMGDVRAKSFAHLEPETISTRRRSEAGDLLRKVGAPPMMIQAQGAGEDEGGAGGREHTATSDAGQDLLTIHEGSRDDTMSNMGSGHLPGKIASPPLAAATPTQSSDRDLLREGSAHSMGGWNSMQNGASMSSVVPRAGPRSSLRDMVAKVRASSARGSAAVTPTGTGGSVASSGGNMGPPTTSNSLEHGVVSSGVVGAGGEGNQVRAVGTSPAPPSSASGGDNSSGQLGSAELARIGSDHSFRGAATQGGGVGGAPVANTINTRRSLPGGAMPPGGEAKDFHVMSSRSRGGAPFTGGPPGPPHGPRPPAQQVNRHRHSIFGASKDASPAKPKPERERKKQVTEHILANNPMAAAKVNAMRTAAGGAPTAGPQASLGGKPKQGVPAARSKFQQIATAAMSTASLSGVQRGAGTSAVLPAGGALSSTLVHGISDDAAAARRGVEELKNMVKGLAAELKSVRSELKSMRSRRRSLSTSSRRDLPSTTGPENSTDEESRAPGSTRGQSPVFPKSKGGDVSPTAAAARRVSAPAGVPAPSPTSSDDADAFTGLGASPGGEGKQGPSARTRRGDEARSGVSPAVVAVDDARAVARDAAGHTMDAGTGSSASTPAEPADAATLLLARLDTLTEQITQQVAASVAASIDRQIDRRLEAAGVTPSD